MPYIRRNADGQIDSLHRNAAEGAEEFLDDQHPEVAQFFGQPPGGNPAESSFSRLDADFVRVIEDVIDTLLFKNILNITDLPAEAQAKLFARKSYRERSTKNSLRLFDSTGYDDVI
jgi:hypothetical protein